MPSILAGFWSGALTLSNAFGDGASIFAGDRSSSVSTFALFLFPNI
jgi:hypothetical protein